MNLQPWEGPHPDEEQREQRRGLQHVSGGASGSAGGSSPCGRDGGSDRQGGSSHDGKHQRGRPSTEGTQEGSSASEERSLRSGTVLPSRRVLALPLGCIIEPITCSERLPGMPPPQTLDYDSDLPSGGFVIGLSHYNSPVYATRCELGRLTG